MSPGFLPPMEEETPEGMPEGEMLEGEAAPEMVEGEQELSESDQMDIDIAAGLGARMMSNEQAVKVLTAAFNGSNPAKMLAMFFAQLIEKIQTKSLETDIQINPVVWLAPGGVLDELDDELSDVAEIAGVPYDQEVMPSIKQELVAIMQQRAKSFEAEGAAPTEEEPMPEEMPEELPQ